MSTASERPYFGGLHRKVKSAVALDLTFVAGFVDVVAFILLYHAFVANMTGNIVHFGRALVGRDYANVGAFGVVLAGFLLGSLVGRSVIEIGVRRRFRTVASITLAIEAALLAAVAATFSGRVLNLTSFATRIVLLALLGIGMGLQTATLTRVGPLTVHTTFVTGMINKFAQLFSHVMFETYDILRSKAPNKEEYIARRRQTARKAIFIFSILLLYFAGVVSGTWLQPKWNMWALYIPVGLLCLAIVADQMFPLETEEEKEEMER